MRIFCKKARVSENPSVGALDSNNYVMAAINFASLRVCVCVCVNVVWVVCELCVWDSTSSLPVVVHTVLGSVFMVQLMVVPSSGAGSGWSCVHMSLIAQWNAKLLHMFTVCSKKNVVTPKDMLLRTHTYSYFQNRRSVVAYHLFFMMTIYVQSSDSICCKGSVTINFTWFCRKSSK